MTILNELNNEATRQHQLSKIMNVEIDDIERNPLNTAPMINLDELEELILKNGVIAPVVVYKVANHQYRLVDGERRYTVSKRLNHETLPALIIDKPANEIDEEFLIRLYNVKRPDDQETMLEKITGFKSLCEKKRERGDEDVRGVRTTDWISAQLGGLSSRTVQEYLTGKYSENYVENLVSQIEGEKDLKTLKPKKAITLKSITKAMEKLRRNLEDLNLSEVDYSYKELIDYDYESGEYVRYFKGNISEIAAAKEIFANERSRVDLLKEKERQLTIED